MEGKGYSRGRFEKLVGKLLENTRPNIIVEDSQISVGILMLLSVAVRSERKKELLECLWNNLLGKTELVESIGNFYRLFCLIAHADLILAQARSRFITDPEELN